MTQQFEDLASALMHDLVDRMIRDRDARQEYPPHITRMPNGQTLGELLSAIDHDPIVPGVFLNGKELRQSEIDRLFPEPPKDAMSPDDINKWNMGSMRYRHDRVRKTK